MKSSRSWGLEGRCICIYYIYIYPIHLRNLTYQKWWFERCISKRKDSESFGAVMELPNLIIYGGLQAILSVGLAALAEKTWEKSAGILVGKLPRHFLSCWNLEALDLRDQVCRMNDRAVFRISGRFNYFNNFGEHKIMVSFEVCLVFSQLPDMTTNFIL